MSLSQIPLSGKFISPRVHVRADPILRIQGYPEPQRARLDIKTAAIKMAERAEVLCQPTGWYHEVQIDKYSEDSLILANRMALRCRDFKLLPSCRSVVVFVLTVGDAIDCEVQALNEAGEVLEALFLEVAAWLAVEDATKMFVEFLRARAAERRCGLTRRFAPGYGDWPLTDQKALFSFFENTEITVELLESCVMVPKMSRSGMYGLRKLQHP